MEELNIAVTALTSIISSSILYRITEAYLTDRIKGKIQSEFDIKLETMKSQLTRSQSLLDVVMSSQKDVYQIAQKERLEAIKLYWKLYIITINKSFPLIEIDRFILPQEFQDITKHDFKGDERILNVFRSLPEYQILDMDEEKSELKALMPFLNDRLYVQLSFLMFFYNRITYLMKKGYDQDNLVHWSEDKLINEELKGYLTNEERTFLKNSRFGKMAIVTGFMEQKMLQEIFSITSGKAGSVYSYNHAVEAVERQDTKFGFANRS